MYEFVNVLYLSGYCKSHKVQCHDAVPTDVMSSVRIEPPPQVYKNEVPTSISLFFTAHVTAQYNRPDLLDVTSYRWDFGDKSPLGRNDPAVSHTYYSSGNYTVSLTVHAPFSSVSGVASLQLTVYKGGGRLWSHTITSLAVVLHINLCCAHSHYL